jgi:hypothetical protein
LDATAATEIIFAQRADLREADGAAGFEEVPQGPAGDGIIPWEAAANADLNAPIVVQQEPPRVLRVRRGNRSNAVRTVYNEIVAEAGLRQDSPGQREVIMDLAVKVLSRLNVRKCDRPQLMAEVVALYFTPTLEQMQTAAVMKNSWHASLRKEVSHAE